jgi:predicted phage terminase large subunit-like protein
VDEHTQVLGYGISEDNKAAGRWETTRGGDYFAAGVGGALAGRRADIALIDDPIRSREDAESTVLRDKTWEWFKFDLETRLKPHGGIVLIQTRWHEDDLAGRLMAERGGQWRVINIPMVADSFEDPLGRRPGDPLWPEWFTEEMRKTAKQDARLWSALYQGRPVPEDGDYFKREWIRDVDRLPETRELRVYGGSDYAVTSRGGDYTCHVVIGVDPDANLYLLDLWRAQVSSDVWVESYCDLVKKWHPLEWAEEQGQIRSGVGPLLVKRERERQAYCKRTAFPTRGDKAVRAQSIRGRMSSHGLRLLRNAEYTSDFISELLRFPAGVHDDQVDALGLVGQLLDKTISGARSKLIQPILRDGWDKAEPAAASWITV